MFDVSLQFSCVHQKGYIRKGTFVHMIPWLCYTLTRQLKEVHSCKQRKNIIFDLIIMMYLYRYPIDKESDHVGCGIGCRVRIKPGSCSLVEFQQDSLECFSLDWAECDVPKLCFEEICCKVINLQSKAGVLKFDVSSQFSSEP